MAKKYIDGAGIGRVIAKLKALINAKANTSHSHSAATTSANGFMAAADKTKLDGIATGANKTVVDTALSSSSTNPVQNKVINTALAGKAASSHTHTVGQISRGTYNLPEGISPVDQALIPNASGARTAFLPAEQITIEVSTDGGATWADGGYTDAQKLLLCDLNDGATVKVGTGTTVTTNLRTRITLKPWKNDTKTERYAQVDLAYIWFNTSGHTCNVTIERSTIGAKTTFVKLVNEAKVGGWSGLNTYAFAAGQFGGGSNQTSNYYAYRFTFAVSAVGSNASYKNKLPYIGGIAMYGSRVWITANSMMKNGHIYSWDSSRNVTFPAKVTASSFAGALTGNADSATKLTSSAGSATQPVYFNGGKPVACTNTLAKSVPADAVFTDTKYSAMTAATSTAAGKAGLVPAPAAGKQASFLRGDGTWAVPTNTTYGAAGSSLGLVKSGGDVTIEGGVITVSDDSHNHTIANVDGLQTALDGKAAASHGTHVSFSTDVPNANGTAAVGTATTVARSDHVHPVQTTVSGNAGSATKLATARTIDGVSFNGSANITHYGTCSTAAATAAKTVALTGFTLATGAKVLVKFTVTNTAANPTLNVNSTGAKAVKYRGAAISAGYLAADRVYEFVYDGTNYELVGDVNTNTTYTNATTSKAGLMSAEDKTKLDGIVKSVSVTLAAASWSSNTQAAAVTGVTASNTVIVSPAPDSREAYAKAGIACTAQAAGQLTFTCNAAPTAAVAVNVVILGG